MGDSKHPLYYLIISSFTNVVLDLLFVAVLGMGVDGAALATVISQAVSAVLGLRRLMHAVGPYRIYPGKIRFNGPMLKQVLTMGIPSGIQNSIIAIANLVVQSSINVYGSMAMAAAGPTPKSRASPSCPSTASPWPCPPLSGKTWGPNSMTAPARERGLALSPACFYPRR